MEDELIGIEDKKQRLMGLLMNGEENEMVVSVVGMGGSGKTTLVANTFNNENVKRQFDCYAWITVSQTYVIEDLFKQMIKKFHEGRKEEVPEHLNSMSYEELLEMLSTYLKSKRYLLVLDDVWDIKLWQEIRIPLLNRHHGSRIMLTTREKNVAFYSFEVESRPLEIGPLGNNEAWELFSKKAFSTYDNKSCPPELESLAWKLVEKCEGLPLAVVTLGGLLSSKRSSSDWGKVYNSLNWHLTNHPMLEPMSSILLLSFNNLPNRLKPCFLYCALFPEDYLIRRKRLIRLWIAEGFVEPIDGVTPEEVAEDYLVDLIARSMLQVEEMNEAGRPKVCKMHDLLRELALSTSKKEKFGATYVGEEIVDKDKIRRLSIQTTETEIDSCTGMSELRSFLVFDSLKKLPSGFKLLRVLDLENAPIDRFPDDLVYLFSLRYLNLRGTLIEELPESIGRLRNLQTLNIRDSKIKALPKAICRLLNLRHLIMYRYTGDWEGFRYVNGTKAASDLSKLQKLQVLSCVESEGKIIKVIRNMTQLTRIGITNVKASDENDLCDSLQKLVLLHYLFLMASDEEEFLRVNELCEPPPELRMVILVGKLERVPLWFGSLDNLTNMYLHWSRLEEDLLPQVQALPNLRKLLLVNAYVGERLCFSRGFIKLEDLRLSNFPLLNSIAIEKGAMPNLHVLRIRNCLELKALPQGIEFLANVERLILGNVPMQLIKSVKGGMDHPKVQHIPEIHLHYKRQNRLCHEKLSGIHSRRSAARIRARQKATPTGSGRIRGPWTIRRRGPGQGHRRNRQLHGQPLPEGPKRRPKRPLDHRVPQVRPLTCDEAAQMIAALPESDRKALLPKLRVKPVPTASGIAVVAGMSKPHRWPHIATTGNICVYRPDGPDSDFEHSTQSYTGYEPTSNSGKVEFILMGGTFMSLPVDYRDYFIRNLHDALSGHTSANAEEAFAYSEHGATKCIGMTIET